jgi:hypothetical protein
VVSNGGHGDSNGVNVFSARLPEPEHFRAPPLYSFKILLIFGFR